jgi:MtfA peptidase
MTATPDTLDSPGPPLAALVVMGFIATVVTLLLAGRLAAGRRARRRASLLAAPLSAEDRRILQESMPLYNRLPADLRTALEGRLQVFLAEKRLEGCNGLVVTHEMGLVVAAHACLLQLGQTQPDYYPSLSAVLLYPSAFLVRRNVPGVMEWSEARSGEAWRRGEVIVSWDTARDGAANPWDGRNVILHEFAHQVDFMSGLTDALMLASPPKPFKDWAAVLNARYQELADAVEADLPTVLHEYAATNPTEFFAVATETFFERPADLREAWPDLYERLAWWYKLDPGKWG